MAARRVSFLNCKGGVGKTTIAINVAASLAKDFDQKVLLVDLDAQSNSSIALMGLPRWRLLDGMPHRTVCCFFQKGQHVLCDAVHQSVVQDATNGVKLVPNLDLIPAIYDLMDLDHDFQEESKHPYYVAFYHQIAALFESYDFIIFDCPPSLGRASKCAIFASPEIYVPAHADFLSNVGLRLLEEKLTKFESDSTKWRKQIPGYRESEIRSVILNSVQAKVNYTNEVLALKMRLANLQGKPIVSDDADLCPIYIRQSIAAAHAIGSQIPLTVSTDNPKLRQDFVDLAKHILKHPLTSLVRKNEPKKKNK